jgi:hypothetical protein
VTTGTAVDTRAAQPYQVTPPLTGGRAVGSALMAKPKRNPGDGRLADMTQQPAATIWEPDLSASVEDIWRFDLGPDSRVTVSTWYEGQRMVKFAIMHLTHGDDGRMVEVARGDSCDGKAHVHTFDHRGVEANRKTLLPVISPEDVARGYGRVQDPV